MIKYIKFILNFVQFVYLFIKVTEINHKLHKFVIFCYFLDFFVSELFLDYPNISLFMNKS